MADRMTQAGARMMANWLKACLSFGWNKEHLDDLEAIWRKFRNGDGSLKRSATVSRVSKDLEKARRDVSSPRDF